MKTGKVILTFWIIFLTHCSHLSTDDPLLDFYENTPPPYTQASLRVTEKAREYIHTGNHDDAIEQLNKALSIDPHNPFAYYFLGFSYYEKGEHKKSNHFLEKAAQLFSSKFWKAQSYELSGLNWGKIGDHEKAKKFFKKAKAIYPNL